MLVPPGIMGLNLGEDDGESLAGVQTPKQIFPHIQFSSVQSLSCVQHFETP